MINPDLDATKDIIQLLRDEFDGVKSYLMTFEKVKKGKLSIEEFEKFIYDLQDFGNNFLILQSEIIPTLKNKYQPVYAEIIRYMSEINANNDIHKLKEIKESLSFEYDIPNRQYLSALIDSKIRQQKSVEEHIDLDLETIKKNDNIVKLIQKREHEFPVKQLQKLVKIQIMDIADDFCTLIVRRMNKKYRFDYIGDQTDPIYRMLKNAEAQP